MRLLQSLKSDFYKGNVLPYENNRRLIYFQHFLEIFSVNVQKGCGAKESHGPIEQAVDMKRLSLDLDVLIAFMPQHKH